MLLRQGILLHYSASVKPLPFQGTSSTAHTRYTLPENPSSVAKPPYPQLPRNPSSSRSQLHIASPGAPGTVPLTHPSRTLPRSRLAARPAAGGRSGPAPCQTRPPRRRASPPAPWPAPRW